MKPLLLLPLLFPAAAFGDAVDDYVKAEMERQHVPGLTLGIIRNGKLVDKRAYGSADLELNVPSTVDDAFEIGSITKMFTAIAAMTLVEEGKLSLDDPVAKWIPEAPELWKPITIRHLLYQTSGLKDYAFVPGIGLIDEYNRAKWMSEMTKLPLDFTPGLTWAYSNSNYALAGWIIEKAAGKPYTEVVTERLLKPAGMTKTVFGDAYQIIPRRSHGYMFMQNTQLRAKPGGTSIASDGSLISTVEDMAKWDAAIGEGKFVNKKSWETIWSPAKLASGRVRAYGMGWNLRAPVGGVPYVGHGGNSAGYSAGYARYPEKGISVVVLANLYPIGGEPMAKKIAEILEPSLAFTAPKTTADPDAARTEKVKQALVAFGDRNAKSDLLDPEMKAGMGTQRAAMSGPNPLKEFDEFLFVSAEKAPGGTWLTYRYRKGERWITSSVLWTPEGRMAQLMQRPDPVKPTAK